MTVTVGMTLKDSVSDHLKVYINQGDITVIGYIGEGASKQLSNFWQNPFEGDTVGQAGGGVSKGADLVQAGTGTTSKSQMNTALVWEGIGPHEINLPVYFKAFRNAKTEVQDALMYLEQMASPELAETVGIGSIPKTCSINIGRRQIYPKCQIREVSYELDAPRDSKGYMTRNTAQLSITMDRMTNRTQVPNLYK
ncbi:MULTISPECIES: hypothetical protein [Shewanella]|uniref:hypothetical protein n=1 Tax=Shewanella TaxID=22 RepID=UPI001AAE83F9|nr:hypothetical protein [Shewanella algae]MBO2580285.1 hypothetical protein [Shewanella algae]HDS1207871.1 hypothetical protein [Shewanella algae]